MDFPVIMVLLGLKGLLLVVPYCVVRTLQLVSELDGIL